MGISTNPNPQGLKLLNIHDFCTRLVRNPEGSDCQTLKKKSLSNYFKKKEKKKKSAKLDLGCLAIELSVV